MSPELDRWTGTVSAGRLACRLPVRADAEAREIVDAALALLFPHFAPDRRAEQGVVRGEIDRLEGWIACFLAGLGVDERSGCPLVLRVAARHPARLSSSTPRPRVTPTRRPPASTRSSWPTRASMRWPATASRTGSSSSRSRCFRASSPSGRTGSRASTSIPARPSAVPSRSTTAPALSSARRASSATAYVSTRASRSAP